MCFAMLRWFEKGKGKRMLGKNVDGLKKLCVIFYTFAGMHSKIGCEISALDVHNLILNSIDSIDYIFDEEIEQNCIVTVIH